MPEIPEDVTMKLRHATRHLQTLNAQLSSFGDRNPYTDIAELHQHTPYVGELVTSMKVNREPLREWSLTIGDCAHNLRATLDYVALALWRTNSGDPTPKELEQIQFPVYSTQRRFRLNRLRLIGGLHVGAKRVIRQAQPYQRRNDPDGHPLALLADINNQDKHRLLHTTQAIVQDAEMVIVDRENLVVTDKPTPRIGSFKDGDVIARVGVMAIGPNPKLNLELHTTYGIAFDVTGPGRDKPVADVLNEIRLYIKDTLLVALKPYF
jgi:hypothetical protein